MKPIFSAIFLSISTLLFANVDLDTMMTEQDKRATGLDLLNPSQKQALAEWIEQHFVLKAKPVSEEKSLYLSVNIQNGKELILSDGSQWEVAPENRSISGLWITPFPLKITCIGGTEYPYELINLNTLEKVRIKRIPSTKNPDNEIESNVKPGS